MAARRMDGQQAGQHRAGAFSFPRPELVIIGYDVAFDKCGGTTPQKGVKLSPGGPWWHRLPRQVGVLGAHLHPGTSRRGHERLRAASARCSGDSARWPISQR